MHSAHSQTQSITHESVLCIDQCVVVPTILSTRKNVFALGDKPCNGMTQHLCYQGLYSLSGKTSYRKISWSLEAARFGFKLFQSLWNLAGTSAALLPRCLSNFRAIRPLQHPISRLRDFTRFGGGVCRWRVLMSNYIIHKQHIFALTLTNQKMFSLICVWINDWVNNHEAGYLRRHRVHYCDTVMDSAR